MVVNASQRAKLRRRSACVVLYLAGCGTSWATPSPPDASTDAPQANEPTRNAQPTLSELHSYYGEGRWSCEGTYGEQKGRRSFDLSWSSLASWVTANVRFSGSTAVPTQAREEIGVVEGQLARIGFDSFGEWWQLSSHGWEYNGVRHSIGWSGRLVGPRGTLVIHEREQLEHSLHSRTRVLSIAGTIERPSGEKLGGWAEICTKQDAGPRQNAADPKPGAAGTMRR
jgi:hypothetical protein